MKNVTLALKYILFDYFSSIISWFLFFVFRKLYIEYHYNFEISIVQSDQRFWLGIAFIPVFWVCLYSINGFYKKVMHKSRLTEFVQTFWICVFGSLVLFFILLLDDNIQLSYKSYYKSLLALFVIQFVCNYIPKFIITSATAHKIHKRVLGFNSIIIGGGHKALNLYEELTNAKKSAGHFFKGYLSLPESNEIQVLSNKLNYLGTVNQLRQIVIDEKIEEVIIALEASNEEHTDVLISTLQEFDVRIKLIADMHSILTGQVKMNSILHAALIEVNFNRMPEWQKFVKRVFDLVVSFIFLVIFSPLYLTIAILVKSSSKGPVFFKQERIGKKGKPFNIIKFRSMFIDAESKGPQLSKDNDSRITPIGLFLRKSRMDEIPQFYNVLKGEMSIVGPRPERSFFIEQIVEKAPQYKFLYKIKPGITSWGQVKYGYAENVEQMVQRLNFDLIYIENRSLLVDLKIMIYTVLVIFQGKGK